MPRRELSDLETHLGFWLRLASNAVSHSFARKVESEGVTVAEWVALRMLHDVDALQPKLLAERMGMTKGAISKLADRLLAKRLIERRPNPEDGRAHALALKPAGRKLVPILAAHADANDAAFFSALDARERRELERLMRKIAAKRGLAAIPIE